LTEIQKHSQFQVGCGGYFEIQYGGHRGQVFGGPVSENIYTIPMNIYAKFGAFIIKCTIAWSCSLAAPLLRRGKERKRKKKK